MFIEIRYMTSLIIVKTIVYMKQCFSNTMKIDTYECMYKWHHSIKFHVMTTLGSIPLDNQRPLGQCSDRGHRAQDLGGGVFP